MKQDPDLLRDILLHIENSDCYDGEYTVEIPLFIANGNVKKLNYHIELIYDEKLVNRIERYESDTNMPYEIDRLTKRGHDFIDQIRDPVAWKWIKDRSVDIGSFSIDTLKVIGKKWLEKKIGEVLGIG